MITRYLHRTRELQPAFRNAEPQLIRVPKPSGIGRRSAGFVAFLLAPTGLVFGLFMVYPVGQAIWLSFFDASLTGQRWVGIQNYLALWHDPVFLQALVNTLLFTLVVVVFQIGTALVIATVLRTLPKRIAGPLRTVFYLPLVVSIIIQAMVWKWIFNPNDYGFANALLSHLNLPPQQWLASPDQALLTIILSTVLVLPGGGIVIYGAAMSGLPRELYEAVVVDGAGPVRVFATVTWPLLKPVTLYLSVIYTIQAFQLFERVYIMTNGGGPAHSTMTLAQYTYVTGLRYSEYGMASAIAVVLLALAAGITAVQLRIFRSDYEY